VVGENAKARASAARLAEEMIERESLTYLQWTQGDLARDAIVDIQAQTEAIKQASLAKALKRLEAGDQAADVLALLANTLANRLLHQPMKTLRDTSEDGDEEIARIARLLLGK